MSTTFMNGATLKELFNDNKYDKTIEPFEKEIDGQIVKRRRFIFRKVAPVKIIRVIVSKDKKPESTFIPLFDK